MVSTRARSRLAVVNVVGFVAVLIVNTLATTIALGGMTTGALSDLYPNLFVPAGLTFSIWGVIYLLIGIYVVYGMIFSLRKPQSGTGFMEKVGILFAITCLANVGWIFSWQYRVLPVSLGCMIVLLGSLVAIYRRLDVGRSTAGGPEKYLVHLPMSIYLGWISIATIANVTVLLVYYKWDRFGLSEQIWAIAMICVGIVLGLIMLFFRNDIFYTLVIDWAVLGILIKRTALDSSTTHGVVLTSIIGLCVLSLGILVQAGRGRVYR
jgi:hypothetical protein